MVQGFDQGIPVTKEQAQVMASNGLQFVGRYINGTWKKMKLAEAQMLSGMGFKLFSIYQTTASMALGNDGFTHGKAAKELAESLNQPSGTPIYFAVDFDVTKESQYAAIREFFIGVKKGLAGAYKVGIYGEHELMVWAAENKGIAERFFQTYAWSGGKIYSGNHVFQYHNGYNFKGYEIDLCKTGNIEDMWNYQVETVKPVETVKAEPKQEPKPEEVFSRLIELMDKLHARLSTVESKQLEVPAPDWLLKEYPNALDIINQKTGTADFWRGYALMLRIIKEFENNNVGKA